MRYLCGFEVAAQETPEYDVIIVGSGIAGLYTALNISEGLRILLLTKDVLSENNSNLAQGALPQPWRRKISSCICWIP